jgi:hypothetical protein
MKKINYNPQTVQELTWDQLFNYKYIDQLNTDLEIANQGGFDVVAPLIDLSLSDDETVEDFKASMMLIQNALNNYRENISKVSCQIDQYKSSIINRSNVEKDKISDKDLELLERLQRM